MKATKLILLCGLGLVVWAAPIAETGLTKKSVSRDLGAVVLSRREEVADDDVIYTDYKRAAQPDDDDDVIYTDYKRSAEAEDDDDVIYTDYKRSAHPEASDDDEEVIYTDY